MRSSPMTPKEYQALPDDVRALVAALKEIQRWIPGCRCSSEYSHLSRTDPGCDYHSDHWEEVELIANLALINFFGE